MPSLGTLSLKLTFILGLSCMHRIPLATFLAPGSSRLAARLLIEEWLLQLILDSKASSGGTLAAVMLD